MGTRFMPTLCSAMAKSSLTGVWWMPGNGLKETHTRKSITTTASCLERLTYIINNNTLSTYFHLYINLPHVVFSSSLHALHLHQSETIDAFLRRPNYQYLFDENLSISATTLTYQLKLLIRAKSHKDGEPTVQKMQEAHESA